MCHICALEVDSRGCCAPLLKAKIHMEKLVLVMMVSWFTPLGFQHTQTHWANYAYQSPAAIATEGVVATQLPLKLEVDSPDYWRLQKEQAVAHIRLMRAAGIDGVFFDLIPRPRLYNPVEFVERNIRTHPVEFFRLFGVWLEAAHDVSPDFKVGIFLESEQKTAEEPSGRTPTVDEWVTILEKVLSVYGSHPNLLKVRGKPCVSNFNTAGNRITGSSISDWSGGWKSVIEQLEKKGYPVYFVADIRPRDVKLGSLGKWATRFDAIQLFAPGAPLSFGLSYQEKLTDEIKEYKSDYWWSVYTGYYRKNRDYTPPDFRRIHELWTGAIRANVPVVQILTWNDINERGEIWPSKVNGDVLLQINSFYSKWYKSGHVPKMSTKVFLACPIQINNNIIAKSVRWPNYPADALVNDACYFWSYLPNSERAQLKINGVGVVNLSPGVSFGVLGEVKVPGPLTVSVKSLGGVMNKTVRAIVDGGNNSENLVYFYTDVSPITSNANAK